MNPRSPSCPTVLVVWLGLASVGCGDGDEPDSVEAAANWQGVALAIGGSAATVGDIKKAGADLAEPRESVGQAADEVVEERDELASDEADLEDARAALVEAESSTTASAPSTTTTTTPLVPAATVDRAERAETELATAAEGISDAPPLTQATAQLNAAAFDGRWTPELTDALEAFQTDLGVPPTGAVDPATLNALQETIADAQVPPATTTTTASPIVATTTTAAA